MQNILGSVRAKVHGGSSHFSISKIQCTITEGFYAVLDWNVEHHGLPQYTCSVHLKV